MRKKKMNNFVNRSKYSNLFFSETLNFVDFKYVFRFSISFYGPEVQPSKVGLKWVKTDKMDPLWRTVT